MQPLELESEEHGQRINESALPPVDGGAKAWSFVSPSPANLHLPSYDNSL
jgi:hypothetical protein